MALEKLVITPLGKNGGRLESKSIKVLFNPSEYSISKTVNWTPPNKTDKRFNAPVLTFKGGGSRQLSLKLFYDVTESASGQSDADVRKETNKLVVFTRIDRELQEPSVLQITWGKAPVGSDFPFTGVITNLTQTFVLFSSNGKPLRANVDVTLLEYLDPEMDKRETDPELTTYRIKRGDTLASISAAMYNDPGQWRRIAESNGLDDPRAIMDAVGRQLIIPES
jgi:hypothetical protein